MGVAARDRVLLESARIDVAFFAGVKQSSGRDFLEAAKPFVADLDASTSRDHSEHLFRQCVADNRPCVPVDFWALVIACGNRAEADVERWLFVDSGTCRIRE